jgi:hypothetical protein
MPARHFPDRCAPDARGETAQCELASYPDVSAAALCRHARAIGLAGERLVDSILLRHGVTVAELPEGVSADRLLLLGELSLKLQIKTRTTPAAAGYLFRMKKGYRRTGAGCRGYAADDYDIAALVALPINTVMFSAARSGTLLMPTAAIPRLARDPLASLEAAIDALHPPARPDFVA